MALLVRTVLRHQTKSLSVLLRTQFRPISVCSVQFNQENRKKNDSITTSSATGNADISTDVRPIGERIKENTKTASYLGVIVVGVAVTGVLIFAVCRELWSSTSSNSVYSAALKTCIDDPRVQDSLGSPIKGYGEESRRRRRQHVAHTVVARNDQPFMKMHFYIQGIRNKATVQLEKRLVRTPFALRHRASDSFSRILFQLFNTNDLTSHIAERWQISIFFRSTWSLPEYNDHNRRQSPDNGWTRIHQHQLTVSELKMAISKRFSENLLDMLHRNCFSIK